ncbi:MAG: hydroxyphenylacetyl-CoA thioesterase PaaI [Nocardioidaceae bacterium]
MGDPQQVAQEVAQQCAAIMIAEDPASRGLGMEIVEVGPGRALVRMVVREDMTNGHDIGHGGFTFSLADTAFAFACNTYNRRTVAQSCEISFLAPTRAGDVLLATAQERYRNGRNGIYDVTVRCGDTVVAEFRGRSREIGGTFFEESDDE